MKQTLLQMTQDILSSMSSDEVNSISDTTESLQIATIIKQKYFDIINRVDLTDHDQLLQLQGSGDITLPTLMYVPDGVANLKWIKYFDSNVLDGNDQDDFAHDLNTDIIPGSGGGAPAWTSPSTSSVTVQPGNANFTLNANLNIKIGDNAVAFTSTNINMIGKVVSYNSSTGAFVMNVTQTTGTGTYSQWTVQQGSAVPAGPGYLYVTVLPNEEFINYVCAFSPSNQNVLSYTLADDNNGFNGNFTFYYKNDQQPTYCTIISNFYVLFDSFDSSLETTLQGSKTMCLANIIPTFTMTDNFIPDLSEEQFQLLFNEAKNTAFYELKQTPHPLADREAQRNWANVQKKKAVLNRPTFFDELPGFGRRRGYYGYKGSFYTGINDSYAWNARGGLY